MPTQTAQQLLQAAADLSDAVNQLTFSDPVTHVYNPLDYAWPLHEQFITQFGTGPKKVLFLGMNPGPWGMAQTGVPFGEVAAVRDWLGLDAAVGHPDNEHPKRPIEGLACQRSEVSGRRLWGLFQERFGTPKAFFQGQRRGQGHWIVNYCPLVFMEASARNRTPDKLPASEKADLQTACDAHLARVIAVIKPEHLVGVGAFAEACLKRVVQTMGEDRPVGRMLHPSPASPAANRGWAEQATRQLEDQGIWPPA